MVTFDPTLTSKDNVDECFCVFTNPLKSTARSAQCIIDNCTRERHQEIKVYMDGACMDNRKANVRCRAGVTTKGLDSNSRHVKMIS